MIAVGTRTKTFTEPSRGRLTAEAFLLNLNPSLKPQIPAGGRKTLGVLTDSMNPQDATYGSQLRDAIDAKCRELDCNLVIVFGNALEAPEPWSPTHNSIFDLVGPQTVDGLILVSSCLAVFTGAVGIERLVQRYYPMPICSIGLEVAGIPSVLTANRTGMAAAMEQYDFRTWLPSVSVLGWSTGESRGSN